MLKLNSSRRLQALLAAPVSTAQPAAVVGYNDKSTSGFDGDDELHDLNSTTAVDICAAPATGAVRHIDYLTIRNYDSAQVTVTVRIDDSGTPRNIIQATLETGEMLGFTHAAGWYVNTADGSRKSGAVQDLSGYVQATLDTDGTLSGNSDTSVPSQKAVKTYADQLIAAADAMVFKGVIDCSANPNYPAADKGATYRVSVAGKIGGASGVNVEIGDLLLCLADSTASGNQATVGTSWSIAQTNIDGAVIGPASVTDSHVALFDGTTGKLIKDSGLTLTGTNTGDETGARLATLHHAASAKTVLVDADEVTGGDSANSFSLIRTTWANVKAFLKTYFDTLYQAVGNYLKYDTTATVSVGYTVTPFSAGTKSSGTFTPDPANGNYQYYTNGGAHTLAAPSSDCGIALHVVNNGSAGAITFSGFTVGSNVGDALTTTNTHAFRIRIERINGVATYSKQALQ